MTEHILFPDYYTVNRSRQPKKDIADYIENQGISVPNRFRGLDHALASGKPFVVRSEHPQDYDGISGFLKSFHITSERIKHAQESIKLKPQEVDWVVAFSIYASDLLWDAHDQIVAGIETTPQEKFEKDLTMLSGRDIARYWHLTKADFSGLFHDTSYSYWELMGGGKSNSCSR